jgi:hypothetical protein
MDVERLAEQRKEGILLAEYDGSLIHDAAGRLGDLIFDPLAGLGECCPCEWSAARRRSCFERSYLESGRGAYTFVGREIGID